MLEEKLVVQGFGPLAHGTQYQLIESSDVRTWQGLYLIAVH
jgi:hypothetical protein